MTFFATCTGVIPSYEVMTLDPSFTYTPSSTACNFYELTPTKIEYTCHPSAALPGLSFTVDFGSPRSICGVLHGALKDTIFFAEFEMFISDDNLVWTSIGNFIPDITNPENVYFETSELNSIFKFANSISTRYIRWTGVSVHQGYLSEILQFMVNCGTCAGQVGCSNTTTGTASCIAGVNPYVPPPADALPAKEMTCDAIPCGTDTCKNIYFRDFLNLEMYWMVVWCSPGDFFCNMYRCDSIL